MIRIFILTFLIAACLSSCSVKLNKVKALYLDVDTSFTAPGEKLNAVISAELQNGKRKYLKNWKELDVNIEGGRKIRNNLFLVNDTSIQYVVLNFSSPEFSHLSVSDTVFMNFNSDLYLYGNGEDGRGGIGYCSLTDALFPAFNSGKTGKHGKDGKNANDHHVYFLEDTIHDPTRQIVKVLFIKADSSSSTTTYFNTQNGNKLYIDCKGGNGGDGGRGERGSRGANATEWSRAEAGQDGGRGGNGGNGANGGIVTVYISNSIKHLVKGQYQVNVQGGKGGEAGKGGRGGKGGCGYTPKEGENINSSYKRDGQQGDRGKRGEKGKRGKNGRYTVKYID